MTNDNIIHQVSQYLAGKLSSEEKAEFEASIKGRLPLQQEIAFQVAQKQMMTDKAAEVRAEVRKEFVRPQKENPFITRSNLSKIAAILIIGLFIGLPVGKQFFSTQEVVHDIVKVYVPNDSIAQIQLAEKNAALQGLQSEKDSLEIALNVANKERESFKKEIIAMQTQTVQQNKNLSPANFQKYQAARQEVEKEQHALMQQISENIAFHSYILNRLRELKACKDAIGEYGFTGNKGLKYKVAEDITLQNRLKETPSFEMPKDDKSCKATITSFQSLALEYKQALAEAKARESLLEKENKGVEGDLKVCEGKK